MRSSLKRRAALVHVVLVAAIISACVHPPASLSPTGTAAFNKTRVLKVLDLLRDCAIDANAQVPPLVNTDLTRKIVTWHRSTITIMKATDSGWKATVQTGLGELLKDVPPKEAAILAPYVTLANTVLMEVSQ